ncbi:hypothetical protein GR925_19230 [Streptomyces sp. HUCO-GS316]|uniref:HNH endonuclease signature motif containing protein n=1 Tax=Streptomyces sp. HUCO-GS316 TaxID=2692198 RepID=UPI0013711394|nr:HNH endonuclease signature motif containing protein [Streptomyces sp. HUCO-GS316]MXM65527.1 hypothetical protein [Streptomyces sp. HUCO-GS316]
MPIHFRQLTVTDEDMARFWPKVAEPDENGCTLWTAGTRGHMGYGSFMLNGRMVMAHRVAWEYFMGDIPPGLVVDHVYEAGCRSPRCVWIGHLEVVTQAENERRKWAAIKARTRAQLSLHV